MSSYYDTSGGQVRLIPGAGTYLQDQAKAQSAYERAKAQLQAQRQQTQIKAGLNKDYQVDPNAQYGSYQQMLQTQGSNLQAANEQAQQRGFFGPGLGNQGESALRYGQAVEALGFKNSLADFESNYQAQLGDLERQKQAEMLGALQSAGESGYGNWTEPGYPEVPYPTYPPLLAASAVGAKPRSGPVQTGTPTKKKKKAPIVGYNTADRLRAGRM